MPVRISFPLIPANSVTRKRLHPRKEGMRLATCVRKDATGQERRYLEGISSGPVTDAHGERMTERCLDGFDKQAVDKAILLIHPHSDNLLQNHIGKLDSTWRTEKGEWGVCMRLWDDLDEGTIPPERVSAAKDFWNMTRGEAPYEKPVRISQFSIQGLLDKSNVEMAKDGTREINHIDLDAIAAVSMGAYPQDDFATVTKIFKQFDTAVAKGEIGEDDNRSMMQAYYTISAELEDSIRQIREAGGDPQSIRDAINSYSSKLADIFTKPDQEDTAMDEEQKAGFETEKPEEKQKDESMAPIADKLNEAARAIAEVAQALLSGGGGGSAGDGDVDMSIKGDEEDREYKAADDKAPDDKKPEDKKKAGSDMPNTEEESDVDGPVQEIKKAFKKMGMTDAQIAIEVNRLKKAANPINAIQDQLEEQRKMMAGMMNSVVKGLESFVDIKINPTAQPVKKSGTTGAHTAMTGSDYGSIPADVKKYLEEKGLTVAQKASASKAEAATVDTLRKNLTVLYGKAAEGK